jgi:hypothetical protein
MTAALWIAALLAQSADAALWPSTAAPAVVEADDAASVELGVRFRSDVAGSIVALRFYKGAGNAGPHIGNLWTAAGTNLARVTFAGETASGWQQMDLPVPVAIAAGTTYVASCFCPQGRYAADNGAFATQGRDAPPLHAPADGVEGGNGVYAYAGSTSFPTETFQSTNYWVDVVFRAAQAPPPDPTTVSPAVADTRDNDNGDACACGTLRTSGPWEALAAAAVLVALLAGMKR